MYFRNSCLSVTNIYIFMIILQNDPSLASVPPLSRQVRGWARAAPLSCILVTQKDGKKPKQKESVDLPFPNAEASVTVGNTPDQLNQRAGSRSHAGGAGPLQSEASRWPSGAARRSPSQRLQGENTQELREAPAEIRPTKPQKAPHTSNTAVPIRQFTFLPPIVSPQLRPGMLGSGAKAPGGRSAEEKGLMLVQNSKMRGTRVGAVYPGAPADVCQSNPRLFSAISTSAQNSCVMAGASPCRAAYCSRLSPGKKVVHLGGAAPRIPAMNPSKAACAVNL